MSKISRRNFLFISAIGSTSLFAHALDRRGTLLKSEEKSTGQQGYDPWIELNLENMTWNLNQIRKLTKVPVMAVIKANGYGHGLIEIGRHLEKAGIDFQINTTVTRPHGIHMTKRIGCYSGIKDFRCPVQ